MPEPLYVFFSTGCFFYVSEASKSLWIYEQAGKFNTYDFFWGGDKSRIYVHLMSNMIFKNG